MKFKLLLFLSLTFSLTTFSQSTVIDEELIGTWTVKKASLTNQTNSDSQIIELLDGFKKGTYSFNSDDSFVFTTKSKSKMIAQLGNILKNNKWVFDEKNQQIRVGFPSDNFSNIIFNVKKEGKNIIFIIEDTNIELIVKKSK